MKEVKNVAALVWPRLLGHAKAENRLFNGILQYYAMERFLYRLSLFPHAGKFILKGALMLRVWGASEFRPTMDIDLLRRTSDAIIDVIDQFHGILAVKTQDDGLFFDPQSLDAEAIAEDAECKGLRVRFLGKLDSARVYMQIDIGLRDVVFPGARRGEIRDKLEQIGSWLGFAVATEKKVADGAVVDVVWEATIGNMGRVLYVFEVQTKGSIDSLLLNLLKALNNVAVQAVVAVSDEAQIEKIKKEAAGINALNEKIRYWDYREVLKNHECLSTAFDSINALRLVPRSF